MSGPQNPRVTQADHVLVKRGLYYRPNGNGYTGLKCEAGLYPADYACGLEGVTAIPFSEAQQFAPACWEETKLAHLQKLIAASKAREAALVEALEAIRKTMDGYRSQMKFCDVEALSYFREFDRRIEASGFRAALTTKEPGA